MELKCSSLQLLLEASKKETAALTHLEAATAALPFANLNSANPALLGVMRGGAKGASQRGAGGTPHAQALPWAREEAAQLSPALPLAESQIAEVVSVQAAESQQGQKRGGRAKRIKQAVRKKQTGKRGRPATQQDENADSNKGPNQQSQSMATSAVSVAKVPMVVAP
ncbi:hypothetical protein WJX77_003126 [Trebouxia sp. C0004]